MTLPQPVRQQATEIINRWNRDGFDRWGEDLQLVSNAVSLDPAFGELAANVLVKQFNEGKIRAGNELAAMNFLQHCAEMSEQLRLLILETFEPTLLEYYSNHEDHSGIQQRAHSLLEALDVGHPQHYFDLGEGEVVTVRWDQVVAATG